LAIIYLGLKLIFRFRANDRFFWIGALIAWIISIALSIIIIIYGISNLAEENTKTNSLQINIKHYKTLYLQANKNFTELSEKNSLIQTGDEIEYFLSDDNHLFGKPRLDILKTSDIEASINIERKSKGSNNENAIENAKHILFDVIQKDSIIILDPYFEIPKVDKWRVQEVKLKLYLPKGCVIHIDKNLASILKCAKNTDDLSAFEMVDKTWSMTNSGLSSLKK
jgi:hypothetical protein